MEGGDLEKEKGENPAESEDWEEREKVRNQPELEASKRWEESCRSQGEATKEATAETKMKSEAAAIVKTEKEESSYRRIC